MTARTIDKAAGERIACFLRHEYPRHTAKHVARSFDISEQTAKGYLKGNPPRLDVFLRMCATFETRFLAYVLEPAGPWASGLALGAHLNDIEDRLKAASAAIADIKGGK